MIHGLDTSFLVALEVSCHTDHAAVRALADALRQAGDHFGLAPQTLAEFLHIVTDAKRFTSPLTMPQALKRAGTWWNAREVDRVWPDEQALEWFLASMDKHRLGRKRLLDTLLAGTYKSANITSILTLNAEDFEIFGEFTCMPLPTLPAQT